MTLQAIPAETTLSWKDFEHGHTIPNKRSALILHQRCKLPVKKDILLVDFSAFII